MSGVRYWDPPAGAGGKDNISETEAPPSHTLAISVVCYIDFL